MKDRTKIYLCDFVHNYLGIGTYMFPLNIGYIAAWANKCFPESIDIELFKYPDNFIQRFKDTPAPIIGFSNYSWNADLNNGLSKWVKSVSPQTITVFGGPNINYSSTGYHRFFDTHNSADFYVLYQGETPFSNLLKRVYVEGLNLSKLKSKSIDGVIFLDKESHNIIQGNNVPRINDLDIIPSPYLTGLLDPFFNTNLIPIVETNRGCPYTCTYCCQGLASHFQMEFFDLQRVKEELNYITHKVKNTNILLFADSNFGIIERDIQIAKLIADLMKEKGYPRRVSMNWAKNQPKLFEIAKILENINLIISLQSLDETVLKKIKRQNVKVSVFKEIIDKVNEKKGMSGTEIILALPGETKESHIRSLRTLFDWNVSYIICYNCLILEGSELSLSREEGDFNCTTKFRLIDNSFGEYAGIKSFEAEEGIRSTSTMSEDEILYFRPIHWLIQFLWNYRFYYDMLKYLQSQSINPVDFIIELIDNTENSAPEKIKHIMQDFKIEAKEEWFDSPELLRNYYSKNTRLRWLKEGNHGKMNSNYIFKVLLEAREEFEIYLYHTAIKMCHSKEKVLKEIINFISTSIIDFRKDDNDIFNSKTVILKYNILDWRNSAYTGSLEDLTYPEHCRVVFSLPQDQEKSLRTLLKQYEHTNRNATLRKMSEYMDIRDFFRKAESIV